MTDTRTPNPPNRLGKAGKRLWDDVSGAYELEEHEAGLLLQLARTADILDALSAEVAKHGPMTPDGRVSPALVEHRQQAIAYARLSAALRLPAGDDGDQAEGRRPQRRPGAKGVYQPRGVYGVGRANAS